MRGVWASRVDNRTQARGNKSGSPSFSSSFFVGFRRVSSRQIDALKLAGFCVSVLYQLSLFDGPVVSLKPGAAARLTDQRAVKTVGKSFVCAS